MLPDPSEHAKEKALVASFRETLYADPRVQGLGLKTNKPDITYTNSQCLKFIRARPASIDAAVEMAIKAYEWRHTLLKPIKGVAYTPSTILLRPEQTYDNPHIQLTPASHSGFDKEGCPIYWEKTGLIQYNYAKVKEHFAPDDLVFYHIQSQEVLEMRMKFASEKFGHPVEKICIVFDMKDLTMSLDLDCIYYIKSILSVDQANYPETLKKLYIINSPWYFTGLFAIFKPFIDKKTVSKFQVLGSNFLETMREDIDLSQIPEALGGQVPDKEFPWLKFSDASGQSERYSWNHLIDEYLPCNLYKKLTLEEIDIASTALETRFRAMNIPKNFKYSKEMAPLLTDPQYHFLTLFKPPTVFHLALSMLLMIPVDFAFSSPETRSIFAFSNEQLALLSSQQPRTILDICSCLNLSNLRYESSAVNWNKISCLWKVALSSLGFFRFGKKESDGVAATAAAASSGILGVASFGPNKLEPDSDWIREYRAVMDSVLNFGLHFSSLNKEVAGFVKEDETEKEAEVISVITNSISNIARGSNSNSYNNINNQSDNFGDDSVITTRDSLDGKKKKSSKSSNKSTENIITTRDSLNIGKAKSSNSDNMSMRSSVHTSTPSKERLISPKSSPNPNVSLPSRAKLVNLRRCGDSLNFNMQVFQTRISHAEVVDGVAKYFIEVRFNGCKWTEMRRYSEFLEVLKQLTDVSEDFRQMSIDPKSNSSLNKQVVTKWPELPPKIYLGSSSSKDVIEYRKKHLETFLSTMLDTLAQIHDDNDTESSPNTFYNRIILNFLDPEGQRHDSILAITNSSKPISVIINNNIDTTTATTATTATTVTTATTAAATTTATTVAATTTTATTAAATTTATTVAATTTTATTTAADTTTATTAALSCNASNTSSNTSSYTSSYTSSNTSSDTSTSDSDSNPSASSSSAASPLIVPLSAASPLIVPLSNVGGRGTLPTTSAGISTTTTTTSSSSSSSSASASTSNSSVPSSSTTSKLIHPAVSKESSSSTEGSEMQVEVETHSINEAASPITSAVASTTAADKKPVEVVAKTSFIQCWPLQIILFGLWLFSNYYCGISFELSASASFSAECLPVVLQTDLPQLEEGLVNFLTHSYRSNANYFSGLNFIAIQSLGYLLYNLWGTLLGILIGIGLPPFCYYCYYHFYFSNHFSEFREVF